MKHLKLFDSYLSNDEVKKIIEMELEDETYSLEYLDVYDRKGLSLQLSLTRSFFKNNWYEVNLGIFLPDGMVDENIASSYINKELYPNLQKAFTKICKKYDMYLMDVEYTGELYNREATMVADFNIGLKVNKSI